MDKKQRIFWSVSSAALILACLFVPYLEQFCQNRGTCMTTGSGFGFVGSLDKAIINIPMLMIELTVITLISGFYYMVFLKDKD
jgi:hypothetical protein